MRKYRYPLILAVVVLGLVAAFVVFARARDNAEDAKWRRASDYFGRADYAKAAKELEDVDMPSSPERLRIYGQTMLATRNLDASLKAYQKLYDLNKDPSVLLIIGNIHNEKKQYDEAIKIYRESIANNPNNAQAYVNLSTLYKLRNNQAEAIRVARDGVENNPGSVTLHELYVSMLMNDKDSTEYKDAVEALRKVSPESPLLESLNE